MIQRSGLLNAIVPLLAKEALPDAAVGAAFGEAMAALARFDFTVVFAYRGQERPIDLFSNFEPSDYEIFVSRYQAEAYLLDPFFHAARQPISGVFRMRELAPDRFFSSEYFRTYYSETRLAEEIGFFVPAENGITVVLSLMRKQGTHVFPAREFALLKDAEPFAAALVKRFWSDLDPRFDAAYAERRRKASPIDAQRGVWQRLGLTTREAAIVELVLQGHSSEAVGERLGIATGTVKVHRRNVYRKLGIASQTQLLSLYLKTIQTTA